MEMSTSGKPVPSPRAARQPQQSTQMHYTLHNLATVAADAAASVHASAHGIQLNEDKAKTVLKEAVDAVVNSFAKHTHSCGRGLSFSFS